MISAMQEEEFIWQPIFPNAEIVTGWKLKADVA